MTTLGNSNGSANTGAASQSAQSSQSASSGTTSTTLSFDATENYWIQAGGNPQAASMAAAVADAESGLNPQAVRTNPDGTTSTGLWLTPTNGNPPGSTDPLASARAALQLSNNGTDWSQWCVTWSDNNCGQQGGTYLGSGSNALGSLATQSENFNVIGAAAAGNGASASTNNTGGTSSSGGLFSGIFSSTGLIFGAAVVVIIIWWQRRRQQPQQPPEVQQ